jgi:hypothetical protein
MSWSVCEYCDGIAELNYGQMWLCQTHGDALTDCAGGLEPLLEMAPEARRALADAMLSRVVREDVIEPAVVYDD